VGWGGRGEATRRQRRRTYAVEVSDEARVVLVALQAAEELRQTRVGDSLALAALAAPASASLVPTTRRGAVAGNVTRTGTGTGKGTRTGGSTYSSTPQASSSHGRKIWKSGIGGCSACGQQSS
jgi:hypothetical protein